MFAWYDSSNYVVLDCFMYFGLGEATLFSLIFTFDVKKSFFENPMWSLKKPQKQLAQQMSKYFCVFVSHLFS